ncbi:MAG: J domain-containing protein [Deltaproteobacteria bacterium]|nr:MAG: J domain-containing protein [Deltaproteobacteria bacterium]
MDLKQCFEILELSPDASADEVQQAYKDLVNIWHPDRFATNPRLKRKAEAKLKEINRAYAMVNSLLSSEPGARADAQKPPYTQPRASEQAEAQPDTSDYEVEPKTTTEAVVEAGTVAVLNLWSYLSTRLRRVIAEQVQAFKEGAQPDQQGPTRRQARPTGRGQGKGAGTGQGRGPHAGRGGGKGTASGRGKGPGGGRGRGKGGV